MVASNLELGAMHKLVRFCADGWYCRVVSQAGHGNYRGGKLDDITVLVAKVVAPRNLAKL